LISIYSSFLSYTTGATRALHSFPTRRSSDLYCAGEAPGIGELAAAGPIGADEIGVAKTADRVSAILFQPAPQITAGKAQEHGGADRKSTRLNSSHLGISYAVFCLKKKTDRNA